MTSDEFRLVALHLHPSAGGSLERAIETAEAPPPPNDGLDTPAPTRTADAPTRTADASSPTEEGAQEADATLPSEEGAKEGEPADSAPEASPEGREIEGSPSIHPRRALLVSILKRKWHEKVRARVMFFRTE